MALTDLLKLSNTTKEKMEDNMLYMLLENFVLGDEGNNIVKELKKEVGQNEIISAFKDWSDFTDKYKTYIDKNTDEYKKIINIFLDCMYDVLPRWYDSRYRAVIFEMFSNKMMFILFKDYANGQELFQSYINDFAELIKKHDKLFVFLVTKIGNGMNSYLTTEMYTDANFTEKQLKEMEKHNVPIKLEYFSPDFRLYHGTSLENYKDILRDGFIKRSNYKNLDYTNVKDREKLFRSKYKFEDNFVFLDAGMDIPISFSSGGYRKNILYWAREDDPEEKERKGDEDSLNSEGVIFIVNPNKYNVYFYPSENQFLIDEDIDIKDTEVIFVHHNGGIISITDKEGNEINDLLY